MLLPTFLLWSISRPTPSSTAYNVLGTEPDFYRDPENKTDNTVGILSADKDYCASLDAPHAIAHRKDICCMKRTRRADGASTPKIDSDKMAPSTFPSRKENTRVTADAGS